MKKILYFLSLLIFFFIFSINVDAAQGELIYNVEKVDIDNKNINIKGYAMIHRTHNYVTVYERNSNGTVNNKIVLDNGGQRVIIRVANCSDSSCFNDESNYIDVEYECKNDDSSGNYNFYAIMGHPDKNNGYGDTYIPWISLDKYNGGIFQNKCESDNSQCYYEDIAFSIDIKVDELKKKFDSNDELYFYIAVSNNHYSRLVSGQDKEPIFTEFRPLALSNVSGDSDYIDIPVNAITGNVNFIASDARWRGNEGSVYIDGFHGCTRPNQIDPNFGKISWCYDNEKSYWDESVANSEYHIMINNENGKIFTLNSNSKTSFLNGTSTSGLYAFCVYDNNSNISMQRRDACGIVDDNGFCIECVNSDNVKILYAFSSWLEINRGQPFKIKLEDPKLCEVKEPSTGDLNCNGSKDYNSTCEELDVYIDGDKSIRVKIEQNGTVSSVLTPDRIYAGGGFSFGIMYYNTIKWSYVSGYDSELHSAVTAVMNKKIKDYDSYVAGINISNIMMGGKLFNNLVKKCATSNTSKDYYNKELTVSCVFTIPKSNIDLIGNVEYYYSSGININNKYYTPLSYDGKYKITADIVGMDRITESSSKSDSSGNTGWTGDWSDTFSNCEIDVYGLLNSNKFIYRPIDINNPFPNRNAGLNWFDWINIPSNQERLENTYSSDIQYSVTLDNKSITYIKNYNKDHNYLEWDDSIDEETMKSSFITENNYIVRGDN